MERAKVLVLDKMSWSTFSVSISDGLAEKIVRSKGETVKKIRDDTGAHIKLSAMQSGEDTRKLLICGKSEEFKNAKSKISRHFKELPSNHFREKPLKKGLQSAKFKKGQESPSPQKFFLEFEN